MSGFFMHSLPYIAVLVVGLIVLFKLIVRIDPDEMGVVTKKWALGSKKLSGGNVIALDGEPGYQDHLLRPGIHIINPIFYSVRKFSIPVVPPGTIGLVYAQVGEEMPAGAKTAVYKKEFGKFTDVRTFIKNGGQKGVQRPVLQSGESAFVHPVGFLVVTKHTIYGEPISSEFQGKGNLTLESFGLEESDFDLVIIGPEEREVDVIVATEQGEGKEVRVVTKKVKRMVDMIGVVETQDGPPVEAGQIACRIGGFADIKNLEGSFSATQKSAPDAPGTSATDVKQALESSAVKLDDNAAHFLEQLLSRRNDNDALAATLLASQNTKHNSYQDFQAFLDAGGRMGVQHDPLLPGTYALNPVAIRVRSEPMLVVNQSEVMVIKSSLGLPTVDTSGQTFKHGSLVRPGHIGVWEMALGTGKYPLNPVIYTPINVKTMVLNLSWAAEQSLAHTLDHRLSTIHARSKEGFEFSIDLQVQIHVPDVMAPLVICMVETMENLVSDILHPAVGNHFRDKLQGMSAINFIETREIVQQTALEHIRTSLRTYYVEVLGVYIQDVVPPQDLVDILQAREKANQNKVTYQAEAEAQKERATLERERGTADKQGELAKSALEKTIKSNMADARAEEGRGEAVFLEKTGTARGAEVRAIGMARAEAYERQVKAIGPDGTAMVAGLQALSDSKNRLVPDINVSGGSSADGLVAMLMSSLNGRNGHGKPAVSGPVGASPGPTSLGEEGASPKV